MAKSGEKPREESAKMYLESASAIRESGAKILFSAVVAVLVWLFGRLVFLPMAAGISNLYGYPLRAIVSLIIAIALAAVVAAILLDLRKLIRGVSGIAAFHLARAGGEGVDALKNYGRALEGIAYVIVASLIYLLFADFLAAIHPAVSGIVLIIIVVWGIFTLWRSCRTLSSFFAKATAKIAEKLESQGK